MVSPSKGRVSACGPAALRKTGSKGSSGRLHLYPRSDWVSWSYLVRGLKTSLNGGVASDGAFLVGSGSWAIWLGTLCVRDSNHHRWLNPQTVASSFNSSLSSQEVLVFIGVGAPATLNLDCFDAVVNLIWDLIVVTLTTNFLDAVSRHVSFTN